MSLISGVKGTANSSGVFKGRDLLLGMPLVFLSGCSLPPHILLDFLMVNHSHRHCVAWRREKVDKKAVYPNELQFRARGSLQALGEAPPGNAARSSGSSWVISTGAPDYEPHPVEPLL